MERLKQKTQKDIILMTCQKIKRGKIVFLVDIKFHI